MARHSDSSIGNNGEDVVLPNHPEDSFSLQSDGPSHQNTQHIDSFLESLTFLTRHFGRSKSSQALVAGLPYDEQGMGPDLFCEAAHNADLMTRIKKIKTLKDLKIALLPVVLVLDDQSAVVLLRREAEGFFIFDPKINGTRLQSVEYLEGNMTGYCILVKPSSKFQQTVSGLEADDNHSSDEHWFWDVVAHNSSLYGMVLLAAFFINFFALTSPLFIMNVYDRVIPNHAIETGWALGLGALMIFGFDFLMKILRAYLLDFAGRRIDVVAARRIIDQVMNMGMAYKPKSSGMFASILKDFDSVRDFFTSATITVLIDLPFTFFFLFIIYQIGGSVAFLLAGLVLIVFILGMLVQIPLKKAVRRAVASSEIKHGLLVEIITGLETIKSIGADGLMRARYMAQVGENARCGQVSRFWSGIGVHIAGFIQQSASILVVLLGMYLVRDAALTMGGLIACVILGGRAIAPIGQIAGLMARYHTASSSLKAVERIMKNPVDRPAGKQFLQRDVFDGKIVFDGVHFAYPPSQHMVLRDASFAISPGEKVGIIGRIGSGKSTIARLMTGLYGPASGHILYDDTDMQQIDPADLRRNLAYISQDITLFSGSVRDNIALSHPQATEEEILAVAKAAGVHAFVSRHPMGYDMPVGEQGSALSGGQRQAIAFARAMLVDPQILICDEPTNAMDVQAENAFRQYVAQQIHGRTFVLITHKHHMLSLVDRLLVVEAGRVRIDGPRDEVLKALRDGKVGAG